MVDRERGPETAVAAGREWVELRRCLLQGAPVSVRGDLDAAADCDCGAEALAGDAVAGAACETLATPATAISTMQERGDENTIALRATSAGERHGGDVSKGIARGASAVPYRQAQANLAQALRCAVVGNRTDLGRRRCTHVVRQGSQYCPRCSAALVEAAELEPA